MLEQHKPFETPGDPRSTLWVYHKGSVLKKPSLNTLLWFMSQRSHKRSCVWNDKSSQQMALPGAAGRAKLEEVSLQRTWLWKASHIRTFTVTTAAAMTTASSSSFFLFFYSFPLSHISHPLLPGHHKVMVLCSFSLTTTDPTDPKWWSHKCPCHRPQVIEPSDYGLKHLKPLAKSHVSSMNIIHLRHFVTATGKLTDSSGLSRNSPCSFRRLWEAKNEHCLWKACLVGALWL